MPRFPTSERQWVRACGTRRARTLERLLKALEWQVKVGERSWEQIEFEHKRFRDELQTLNKIHNRNLAIPL